MNERIDALRELIYEGISKALEIDLRYKSYEGELEVTVLYPNYFEWIYGQGAPVYVIRLDSCVLGPSRHYEWVGATLDEAIDEAMRDVTEWVKEVEEKRAEEWLRTWESIKQSIDDDSELMR